MAELVRSQIEDKQTADKIISRMESRSFIDMLMAKRAKLGMNQSDLANKLGCSQSRISKLENGFDDELRIADIREYCTAIGLDFTLLLSSKGHRKTEQIKYHILAVRKILHDLADLSDGDEAMVNGLKTFCAEVLFNSAFTAVEVGKRLNKINADEKLPDETLATLQIDDGETIDTIHEEAASV